MKLCRFISAEMHAPHYGIVEGESIRPLIDADAFGSRPRERSGNKIPLESVRLVAPITPSKIVCVGRNYVEHAAELGNAMPTEPLLFLKAPSAIIGSGEDINLPPESAQVEYEGELGLVVGRRAHRLGPSADPLSYLLGYCCLNDVTARDLQRKDGQFTRAKSFDTFCPVGPFIVTDIDPENVSVTTRVNGVVKQNARTSAMVFPVRFIVNYISQVMTLNPGDLIATGTPAGVGKLSEGDLVEVEVEGIGVLKNNVKSGTSITSA